jgi:hypothetical protein
LEVCGVFSFFRLFVYKIRLLFFSTGDLAHGHSHGGDDNKSKNKKDKKNEEENIEAGDNEHLCADERIPINDEQNHHGHSHNTAPVLNNGVVVAKDEKKSKGKKKGCKTKLVTINKNLFFAFC